MEDPDKKITIFNKKWFVILLFIGVFILGGLAQKIRNEKMEKVEMIKVVQTPEASLDTNDLKMESEEMVFAYDFNDKTVKTRAYSQGSEHRLITFEEFNMYKENFIEPFFDYYNEGKEEGVVAITLVQRAELDKTNSKYYATSLNIVYTTGDVGGFLIYPEAKYWYPECMEVCEFSDSFKKKYPDLVKSY